MGSVGWLNTNGKCELGELCYAKSCSQVSILYSVMGSKCYMNLVSVVSLEAKCPPRSTGVICIRI